MIPYKYLISLFLGISLLALSQSCTKETDEPTDQNPVNIDGNLAIDLTEVPYAKLSDYGFFEGNIADFQPTKRVLPYDLQVPLFSDYAQKSRFIYLPPDAAPADYKAIKVLDFPVGTVIVKSFYYNKDFRDESQGKRIIETRLLIRTAAEWLPASYLWNDAQTEATFSLVGKIVPVEWIHYDGSQRVTNYIIPTKNDCKGCHNIDKKIVPIGPKIRNLNKTYLYADGPKNQLDKWTEMGYLTNVPASPPSIPSAFDTNSGTLDQRARAYLDINCGHCHRPDGPANNSALILLYHETDPASYGICKTPVAAGGGTGGNQYGIVPGQPAQSIMMFRLKSTKADEAMPELGRTILHQEGIDLIQAWIASLEGEC